MVKFITVTGAAHWASYLVNGDASGLDTRERWEADQWTKRNGIEVCDVARDAAGEGEESRFTWSYQVHCPDSEARGGSVVDYIGAPYPRLRLWRVRLNSGGYEYGRFGSYFGTGAPLYAYENECGDISHIRAESREAAKAAIQARIGGFRFYH